MRCTDALSCLLVKYLRAYVGYTGAIHSLWVVGSDPPGSLIILIHCKSDIQHQNWNNAIHAIPSGNINFFVPMIEILLHSGRTVGASWHERKTQEREISRQGFYIPWTKAEINPVLGKAPKSMRHGTTNSRWGTEQ